jgi:hypothetical protein
MACQAGIVGRSDDRASHPRRLAGLVATGVLVGGRATKDLEHVAVQSAPRTVGLRGFHPVDSEDDCTRRIDPRAVAA